MIARSGAEAESQLGQALAALDRRDYATARRLFEALGRKDAAGAIENALTALDRGDYATAQGLFEALKPETPTVTTAPMASASRDKADPKPVAPPHAAIPSVEPSDRLPAPRAGTEKRRGSRMPLLAACLALLALVGVAAHYGVHRLGALVAPKSQAVAGVAPAAESNAASPKANTAPGAGAADLGAALARTTERLDRIERETGQRLEALGQRLDPDASAKLADLSARLDALEKRVASPAPPAPDAADLSARLDRLEKKAAVAATPPSQLSEFATRLDRLEKKAAATMASAAKPPSASQKSSTAPPRTQPDAPRRLLEDYSVAAVQNGVAVVEGRYGAQQVAPGDVIPGAGRVLRIERRGGDWYVLTSGGVIASASALYGAPY